MERFPKRHSQTLNELLVNDFDSTTSDFTFRLLVGQLDVLGFDVLLHV